MARPKTQNPSVVNNLALHAPTAQKPDGSRLRPYTTPILSAGLLIRPCDRGVWHNQLTGLPQCPALEWVAGEGGGGAGELGTRKIWNGKIRCGEILARFLNTTAQCGTKFPDCGMRTSIHRKCWLLAVAC